MNSIRIHKASHSPCRTTKGGQRHSPKPFAYLVYMTTYGCSKVLPFVLLNLDALLLPGMYTYYASNETETTSHEAISGRDLWAESLAHSFAPRHNASGWRLQLSKRRGHDVSAMAASGLPLCRNVVGTHHSMATIYLKGCIPSDDGAGLSHQTPFCIRSVVHFSSQWGGAVCLGWHLGLIG